MLNILYGEITAENYIFDPDTFLIISMRMNGLRMSCPKE